MSNIRLLQSAEIQCSVSTAATNVLTMRISRRVDLLQSSWRSSPRARVVTRALRPKQKIIVSRVGYNAY